MTSRQQMEKVLRRLNRVLLAQMRRHLLPSLTRRISVGTPQMVEHNPRILLFPYSTPACQLQHELLRDCLNYQGFHAEIAPKFSKKSLSGDLTLAPSKKSLIEFNTFSGLVDYLEEFAGGIPLIARGLIDEFVRKGPVSSMTGNPAIPREFLDISQKRIDAAREAVQAADAVVVADSAYLYNRTLMAEAEASKKPSWILNPDGVWLQASSLKDDAVNPSEYFEVQDVLNSNPRIQRFASRYARKRFAGRSANDLDSSGAFKGSSVLPEWLQGRKVLFLHAFRDASNIPLDQPGEPPRAIFRTYFEWAEFVFSVIAKRQEMWAIKQHPSARFYEGDDEILLHLRQKYKLNDVPLLESVSTKAVLENRVPIFTHSGTVSMESAAYGYKSNICATKYPVEIANQILDVGELESALLDSSLEKYVQPIDESARLVAEGMLYLRYDATRSTFAPTIGQANRDNQVSFNRDLLRQQLSLLLKSRKPEVVEDFKRKVAAFIDSTLSKESNG